MLSWRWTVVGVVVIGQGQCLLFFDPVSEVGFGNVGVWPRVVDCSDIGVRAHERLFMPNRENLGHGDLKFRLEKEVEERVNKPGVSVGLVWTPVGGALAPQTASACRAALVCG